MCILIYSKFVSFLRKQKHRVVQSSWSFFSELSLKGGMLPQNNGQCCHETPWNHLVQKLELIGLQLYSHWMLVVLVHVFSSQLHTNCINCNADLHYHVRTAGINNMNSHPELYVT